MVQKESKPKKPKTKIAVAKKILNKNVTINTKIVFDDEGEVRYKLFNMLCTFYFILLRDVLVAVNRLKQMFSQSKSLEWFSLVFRKTKTKVIICQSQRTQIIQ